MNYTVITASGKVMTFFVKAVAETFVAAYGGVLVTNEILVQFESVL